MPTEWVLAGGLAVGAIGYLALAWYVWRYRAAAGAWGLVGVLVSVCLWTTFYVLELASRTVAEAEIWSAAKYIGICGLAPVRSALRRSLRTGGQYGVSRLGDDGRPILSITVHVAPERPPPRPSRKKRSA